MKSSASFPFVPHPFAITDVTSIPVCCALIEHGGRLLVAQRPAGKHLAGQWEFPGGQIEEGESAESALRREIREELGCELTQLAPLDPVTHAYGDRTITLHPRVAQLAAGSPLPRAREHAAIRWLDRTELFTFEVAQADRLVLTAYLDRPT